LGGLVWLLFFDTWTINFSHFYVNKGGADISTVLRVDKYNPPAEKKKKKIQ
jgi:hypothetical protein